MNTQQYQTMLKQRPELVEQGARSMQKVLERSAVDPDFRTRLLANPSQAIPEVTGQPFPSEYKLTFIENKADVTIVLPDPVLPQPAELNEAELEAVAGGCSPATASLILSVIASAIKITQAVMDADAREGTLICN
jgi:hypothetical protein